MAIYSKSRTQLLYDVETTFGSDPAVAAAISLPYISLPDIAISQEPVQSTVIGGGNRNPRKPTYGNKSSDCSINMQLELTAIGYLLKALMGAPTTTDNGDGTYSHVFKIGNTISSFLLEKGFVDVGNYYKYNGLVANGLSFSIAPGDSGLNYTLNCLGGGYEELDASDPYDAAPTDLTRPDDWVFKPDATIKEGGSSDNAISDFTLDITDNMELVYGLNGAGRATCKGTSSPKVSGTITSGYNGDAKLLKGREHTESSLEVTTTDSTKTPNESLIISIPELEYGQTNPAVDSPGLAVYTQAWVGYYQNGADASAIKITLTNDTASY